MDFGVGVAETSSRPSRPRDLGYPMYYIVFSCIHSSFFGTLFPQAEEVRPFEGIGSSP